jgi:hypothetical protein
MVVTIRHLSLLHMGEQMRATSVARARLNIAAITGAPVKRLSRVEPRGGGSS